MEDIFMLRNCYFLLYKFTCSELVEPKGGKDLLENFITWVGFRES